MIPKDTRLDRKDDSEEPLENQRVGCRLPGLPEHLEG